MSRWRDVQEPKAPEELVDLLQPRSPGAAGDVKEVQIILHDVRAMLKKESASRADLEALFRQLSRVIHTTRANRPPSRYQVDPTPLGEWRFCMTCVIQLGARQYFNHTGEGKDNVLIQWRNGIQIGLYSYGTGKPVSFRMIVNPPGRKPAIARFAVLDLSQDLPAAGLEDLPPAAEETVEKPSEDDLGRSL